MFDSNGNRCLLFCQVNFFNPATIAMIAETQHSDSDYAAGMIFITTLFSIVTLPLVCLSL